jgi:hypothetical protein
MPGYLAIPPYTATGVPMTPTGDISATNVQSAMTEIASEKATLASPTFTGTVVLPSTTSIGTVSNTELGYIDGVTSAVQTQINTVSNNLTSIEALAMLGL